MKKRIRTVVLVLAAMLLAVWLLSLDGGYSGSAAADLREALVDRYGEPYTGKVLPDGSTEDMAFRIEAASPLLTNRQLRHFFSWDYHYRCTVTYTVHGDGGEQYHVHRYDGYDPMGPEHESDRAYLDLDSMTGQVLTP